MKYDDILSVEDKKALDRCCELAAQGLQPELIRHRWMEGVSQFIQADFCVWNVGVLGRKNRSIPLEMMTWASDPTKELEWKRNAHMLNCTSAGCSIFAKLTLDAADKNLAVHMVTKAETLKHAVWNFFTIIFHDFPLFRQRRALGLGDFMFLLVPNTRLTLSPCGSGFGFHRKITRSKSFGDWEKAAVYYVHSKMHEKASLHIPVSPNVAQWQMYPILRYDERLLIAPTLMFAQAQDIDTFLGFNRSNINRLRKSLVEMLSPGKIVPSGETDERAHQKGHAELRQLLRGGSAPTIFPTENIAHELQKIDKAAKSESTPDVRAIVEEMQTTHDEIKLSTRNPFKKLVKEIEKSNPPTEKSPE